MSATSADVGDHVEAGKIVRPYDAGDVALGLLGHRLSEDAARVRVLHQVPPDAAGQRAVRAGFACPDRRPQLTNRGPQAGQPEHANQ